MKMRIISIILGILIIFFAFASTCVSTGLSIAYFSGLTDDETLTMVVYGFVILLQGMVLLGSVSKAIIYKRTPQHYYSIVVFTRICFALSVLSTISFFNSFDKTERIEVIQDLLYTIPFFGFHNNDWIVTNLTNMTLIWASCVVLDLMSMYFPSIGSDLITGISIKEKINLSEKGYITKIYEIITFLPKRKIDQKCYDLGIIDRNEKLSTCNEEKKLSTCNEEKKLSTCNEEKELSTLQKELSTLRTQENVLSENCTQENVINEKCTQENVINENCNEVEDIVIEPDKTVSGNELSTCNEKNVISNELSTCNEKNVISNEENVMNSKCNELITKIDDYILDNYKCNEKINVSEIKTKFGFKKSDRRWNKIRENLSTAKVLNGKLTRIEITKQEKEAI